MLTRTRPHYFSPVYQFMKISSKYMKYSPRFKLKVIEFAQKSNNCAAGNEFYFNEKLVHHWGKQGEKLKCMPKNKCSNCGKKFWWLNAIYKI